MPLDPQRAVVTEVEIARLRELDLAALQARWHSLRGRLADGVDTATVLRAIFPGGSITGAPKVRAMEITAEIEDAPRGVYTGALGLFDPRGDCELALPIRTAVVRGGLVTYHAGGGIVADSDPESELAECWTKTAALRRALESASEPPVAQCSSG